jgi:multicomponent Na+:H+ antiporter subunit C
MIGLVVAILVAALLATGTYSILQRSAIRMVVGLGLLSHGVNLLLFGTGTLKRGQPPIVVDKEAFTGDISQFVDPLPQSLILTAIVISFGITAFMLALFNRRHALELTSNACGDRPDDPFTPHDENQPAQEDYVWLEDIIARQRTS